MIMDQPLMGKLKRKIEMTGDSLSGQNKNGRITGAGSSPALLTKLTESQKTKLWKRLRRLDRQIHIKKEAYHFEFIAFCRKTYLAKIDKDLYELDKQRKQVRRQLKGYGNEN